MAQISDLKLTASRIRGKLVEMSHRAKTPHLGSSLSCVEMLVASYFHTLRIDPTRPDDPDRDRFILSKGHAATAIYTTLAFRGFFDPSVLDGYNVDGGPLAEHPGPRCVPGIEAATGSLGHGLSIGLGMAVAGRIAKRDYRVFALMSDGECNEGSVWEAALFAAANGLDRVCALIDYNKWQATGRSDEVLGLPSLAAKWAAFNWHTIEVDGHDIGAIIEAMRPVPHASGKPTVIVCHTVKGKGVSFMEDDNNWHYRIPTAAEVTAAHAELGLA
jgi:transketolase